jgi:hypothetical protein
MYHFLSSICGTVLSLSTRTFDVACVKKRKNVSQIVILVHRNLSFYMRHKKCSLFLKLVFKCRMSGAMCGFFFLELEGLAPVPFLKPQTYIVLQHTGCTRSSFVHPVQHLRYYSLPKYTSIHATKCICIPRRETPPETTKETSAPP